VALDERSLERGTVEPIADEFDRPSEAGILVEDTFGRSKHFTTGSGLRSDDDNASVVVEGWVDEIRPIPGEEIPPVFRRGLQYYFVPNSGFEFVDFTYPTYLVPCVPEGTCPFGDDVLVGEKRRRFRRRFGF
jgi:hypothetical protein